MNEKTQLPNNCYISKMTVNPSNWDKTPESLKVKDWYITYRFYDNTTAGRKTYPKGCPIRLRGLVIIKNWKERCKLVIKTMSDELSQLKTGFNPTKKIVEDKPTTLKKLRENTLSDSLQAAFNRLKISPSSKAVCQWVLNNVNPAAKVLSYDTLPIDELRRHHIGDILEQCEKEDPEWNNSRFNHHRAYLMILCKQLVRMNYLDTNPVRDIEIAKWSPSEKKALTRAELQKAVRHLSKKENCESFHRFVQIFFYSSSRTPELLRLKPKDVNLEEQMFTITMKKGRNYVREERVIMDVALPYWKEAMNDALPDQYIFSRGLLPGDNLMHEKSIYMRWKRNVQLDLGIKASWYKVKGLGLEEIAEALTMQDAANAAGHKSVEITMKHYAKEQAKIQKRKEMSRLKQIGKKL